MCPVIVKTMSFNVIKSTQIIYLSDAVKVFLVALKKAAYILL